MALRENSLFERDRLDVISGQLPSDYYFSFHNDILSLCKQGDNSSLYIDFCRGELHHRAMFGGNRSSLLAKAIGARSLIKAPKVLDATAGLARDSFILATLGCHVQMLERSSVLATLIHDALRRAHDDEQLKDVIVRMNLIQEDAKNYLKNLSVDSSLPDVIYLDPMFPHEKRSALVKKEMRILREIVGGDLDADELLAAALSTPVKRIVVKRMRTAPPIKGFKFSQQLFGKTNRFDLYLR